MPEPNDGFVLQANLITPGLCQDSYCSLLGLLSASLEFQPFTLCSVHQCGFGVRGSPSSHPRLIPGQFGSLKAPGSTYSVQDEFLVAQHSFYCPKSLQTQHLPTSVARPAVRAPPVVSQLSMQLSYQMFFGLIALLNYTNTISAPRSII